MVGRQRPGQPAGSASLASVSERLALVVTELAGNALRHASPPVHVLLQVGTDGWLLMVTDRRPGAAPAVREPDPEQGGGRGLHLVRALSQGVGWYAASGRKCVWALLGDEPPPALLATLRRAAP